MFTFFCDVAIFLLYQSRLKSLAESRYLHRSWNCDITFTTRQQV